jgi:hypothetical protein
MRVLSVRLATFAGLLGAAGLAQAQLADFAVVPEPGMLALAGIGAAAAVAVSLFKRRK